jgi:ectoine hydroxylase-related dioxygenase (phytanoyl-CoA dioxygenase family)
MSPIFPSQSSLVKPDITKRMLTILRKVFSFAIPAPVSKSPPKIARHDARDPETTTELLVSVIERDGGVILENLITSELAARIKSDLAPYFDTDKVDPSGFFPTTTQRATGLLAKSDACVELACNKTYWTGQTQETVTGKPIISSTVGFRVNPGGRQQDLHRDDGYVCFPYAESVLKNFQ